MEDCYKIIGTSKEAVNYRGFNSGKNGNQEKDIFIREKYEHAIKLIENKKKLTTSPEELEKFNQQIERIIFAYNQIKSPILRDIYDRKMEDEKQQTEYTKNNEFRKKTAYNILDVSYESICLRTDNENDRILRERRNRLLDYYEKMLENSKNFSDKTKIELEIKKIEESYELVKTADKRKAYHAQLQKEKQERDLQIRRKKIEKQYSHASEYNPSLIDNRRNSDNKLLKNKMVTRKEEISEEHLYPDIENRKLRMKRTGIIIFQNWSGTLHSYVNEYEIKREIGGQEIKDVVYTDISELDLQIDKKTGKPFNPDYYDCVVNTLLGEDTIEGAKYNEGYIGMVEQNEEGEYYITLGEGKLKPKEQEMLTAVMIMKKREEKIKQEGKDEK